MRTQRTVQVGSESLSLETGHIAKQAHGACVVRLGDTVVLTTACMAASTMPRDFLPLTVDYREYAYAAGRIPGGFFKREGRSTEKETITARMIDRPLRPLFPAGYTSETQIISFVLSADGEHDPDILAINGASTALVLSEIPFYHPIAAVRVGLIDGQLVFNPTNSQRDVADLDLIVVGTEQAVMMVEAGANQLSEQMILDCIWAGHAELQKIIQAQISMFRERGLSKPAWTAPEPYPQELYQEVRGALHGQLKAALHTQGKFERKDLVSGVQKAYLASIPEEEAGKRAQAKKVIETLEEEILYDSVLNDRTRFDSRRLDEIRAIDIEVGVLPRTHGSALFTRGETQALATVTLGTQRDAQIIESYEGESKQKFLLHYNFPPFSVGEVKFLRGASRREIGHGVLARRALLPVLPNEEDFPYTIRVVSDILESNGSSSMATVCGGSLALFDAGVPMLAPVAGVAMGLVQRGDNFAVLTDIAGQEDHYGDMDFKVAGTRQGITALQMDIKVGGVSKSVMETALEQARVGRLHILGKMEAIIGAPRQDLSTFAPRLYTIQINKEKIRDIIGPGGKTIRSIVEETGCQVEVENDGRVIIASPNSEAAKRAIQMIERLTQVPEIGKIYSGTVRRVEAYGCFVEIMPGTDGLVHISELAPYRVRETSDVVKEGDELTVKVVDIDDTGRVRLSRKAVIVEAPDYDPAQYAGMGMSEDERPPRAEGPQEAAAAIAEVVVAARIVAVAAAEAVATRAVRAAEAAETRSRMRPGRRRSGLFSFPPQESEDTMPHGELSITELADHLEQLLDASQGKDYCPNGLQVQGRRPIRKIATGVSSCVELFDRARDAEADAVLVHHGLFWDGMPRQLTGHTYSRVATLLEAGMHLLAYHLPLDRHPELGNNILAVKQLGLYSVEPFAEYEGLPIGFRGRYPEPVSRETLVERCRAVFGQEPLAFLAGPEEVSTVGMVSGGAAGELHQAIAAGLDAYITGEPAEWVMNVARESRIHFLAVGHHASERLGIRALGEHLATRFGLAHEFIDVPNPV